MELPSRWNVLFFCENCLFFLTLIRNEGSSTLTIPKFYRFWGRALEKSWLPVQLKALPQLPSQYLELGQSCVSLTAWYPRFYWRRSVHSNRTELMDHLSWSVLSSTPVTKTRARWECIVLWQKTKTTLHTEFPYLFETCCCNQIQNCYIGN